MPIEYEVDAESQLLLISYLGPVAREEILEHRAALESDARGVLRYNTIVDLRSFIILSSSKHLSLPHSMAYDTCSRAGLVCILFLAWYFLLKFSLHLHFYA